MTDNNDVVKKIFSQFDVLMAKNLEMITGKFNTLSPPEPPKRKRGKKVLSVQNPQEGTQFDGNI